MKASNWLRASALALTFACTASHALDFQVYAQANSSTGGTGLDTVSLAAGQPFSVSALGTDLWNAGPLPRWSNANGLTGDLFATGTDESGQLAGTLIGQDFGLHSQGGFSAPFGALVGQIGAGNYFLVGTLFNGVASAAGTLKLYYWDSNNGDNTDFVTANVTAIPEPETYALIFAGLGLMGFVARRRRPQS